MDYVPRSDARRQAMSRPVEDCSIELPTPSAPISSSSTIPLVRNAHTTSEQMAFPPSYTEATAAPTRSQTKLLILELDNHKHALHSLIDDAKLVEEQTRLHDLRCTELQQETTLLVAISGYDLAFLSEWQIKRDRYRAWLRKTLLSSEKQARKTLAGLTDKHFLPPKECRQGCVHIHITRRERVLDLEDLLGHARRAVADVCGELDLAEMTWRKRILVELNLE